MPVDLVRLSEIQERKRILTDQALDMEAGPERAHVLAEIELLRRLADFKVVLETVRMHVPEVSAAPSRASRRATRKSGGLSV